MAKLGERPDIERKIKSIGERIIKGKRCSKNSAVRWYVVHKYFRLFSSSLTSIGISHPLINAYGDQSTTPQFAEVATHFVGWPIFAAIGGIAGYAGLVFFWKVFHNENIEQEAGRALGAADSFSQLEAKLEGALDFDDPLTQLNKLQEESVTLASTYYKTMSSSEVTSDDINTYANRLIQKKSENWIAVPPQTERRGA